MAPGPGPSFQPSVLEGEGGDEAPPSVLDAQGAASGSCAPAHPAVCVSPPDQGPQMGWEWAARTPALMSATCRGPASPVTRAYLQPLQE